MEGRLEKGLDLVLVAGERGADLAAGREAGGEEVRALKEEEGPRRGRGGGSAAEGEAAAAAVARRRRRRSL